MVCCVYACKGAALRGIVCESNAAAELWHWIHDVDHRCILLELHCECCCWPVLGRNETKHGVRAALDAAVLDALGLAAAM